MRRITVERERANCSTNDVLKRSILLRFGALTQWDSVVQNPQSLIKEADLHLKKIKSRLRKNREDREAVAISADEKNRESSTIADDEENQTDV